MVISVLPTCKGAILKKRPANDKARETPLKGDRSNASVAPVAHVTAAAAPRPAYHHALWDVEILSALMHRLYQRQVRPLHGLATLEWHVLDALQYAPGATAVEFAQSWACDKMALSRAVNSLKQAGLIQTVPAADDRRKVALYLTKEGMAAVKSHLKVVERLTNDLLDTVSAEELTTMNQTIRRLIGHFQRVTSETSGSEGE
jgi:DNA-binding MarR family transcriptional regulator